MATLCLEKIVPRSHISERAAPLPLRKVLLAIFQGLSEGLWLVGGTALAGYYAEHRRSDDLDLFAMDSLAYRSAVLAIKSLSQVGIIFSHERHSSSYYHVDAQLEGHSFTIDVVLDEHLHEVGHALKTEEGVWIADLPTLFAMKVACLVSRCSEKDLFDLDWIFQQVKEFSISDLIEAGAQIDAGLNVETLLISLQGTVLHKSACHFLLPGAQITPDQVYKKILLLQKNLIRLLLAKEQKMPLSEEAEALRASIKEQKTFRPKSS